MPTLAVIWTSALNRWRTVLKKAVAATVTLALGAAPVFAKEVPAKGRKGAWSWHETMAESNLGSGLIVLISFPEINNCETALLILGGNSDVTRLSLTVDGENYGYAEMQKIPGVDGTAVKLGPEIVSAIKHGRHAKVTTNVGWASMSLDGSAKALNAAHGNCREMTKPLVATAPMPTKPQTTAQQTGFFGEKVRTDGTEMFAVNDVVTILNDIQEGDDKLLEQLVVEMETAGLPFKSVMFVQNNGGSLQTAMKMGAFIRRKQANTAVGGYPVEDSGSPYCASACVYAFAGGVQKTIYLPAKVGLHQTSLTDGSEGTMEVGQKVVAAKYEYLSQMGIDPAIVIEGSKKAPDEMWWLTGYEAKGYGLATKITKPHEVGTPTDSNRANQALNNEPMPKVAPALVASAPKIHLSGWASNYNGAGVKSTREYLDSFGFRFPHHVNRDEAEIQICTTRPNINGLDGIDAKMVVDDHDHFSGWLPKKHDTEGCFGMSVNEDLLLKVKNGSFLWIDVEAGKLFYRVDLKGSADALIDAWSYAKP